jgi:hypothetical protein
MPLTTPYLFVASMDVDPAKERVFNEVYDQEHVPLLLTVPGVLSVARFRVRPFEMAIGGERKRLTPTGEPRYTALYELDRPDVLVSEAWARAVDQGRWPDEVRPFTRNRRHVMFERLGG